MSPHDAQDERVKMLHEGTRRGLIALANASKTAREIESLGGVRHGTRERNACTEGKTTLSQGGYSRRGRLPARRTPRGTENAHSNDHELDRFHHGLPIAPKFSTSWSSYKL
jgi:hypothetical protein